MTWYPIVSGQEGVKPRTLHAFMPHNIGRTICQRPTENGVSFFSEDDGFCPTCFPSENHSAPMVALTANVTGKVLSGESEPITEQRASL